MDKELLAMLVCPLCNGKLKYDRDAQELRCHYDGLAYPIQEGIPVMLPEEARPMDVDEKLHTSPGRSPGSAQESFQESSQESSRESSPPSSQTGASGHPGGA